MARPVAGKVGGGNNLHGGWRVGGRREEIGKENLAL
jgi:hypothetical protein